MSRFWMIGFTVVGKPIATVRTSSPSTSRRLPSLGLVERAERDEVGAGPTVDEDGAAHPHVAGQGSLELLREATCRQPSVEGGVHHGDEVLGPQHLPGDGHGGLPRHELGLCVLGVAVPLDLIEDLGTVCIVGCAGHQWSPGVAECGGRSLAAVSGSHLAGLRGPTRPLLLAQHPSRDAGVPMELRREGTLASPAEPRGPEPEQPGSGEPAGGDAPQSPRVGRSGPSGSPGALLRRPGRLVGHLLGTRVLLPRGSLRHSRVRLRSGRPGGSHAGPPRVRRPPPALQLGSPGQPLGWVPRAQQLPPAGEPADGAGNGVQLRRRCPPGTPRHGGLHVRTDLVGAQGVPREPAPRGSWTRPDDRARPQPRWTGATRPAS